MSRRYEIPADSDWLKEECDDMSPESHWAYPYCVWVVWQRKPYDGRTLLGVYATEEIAEKAIKEFSKDNDYLYRSEVYPVHKELI